jgi:hypothetical protein
MPGIEAALVSCSVSSRSNSHTGRRADADLPVKVCHPDWRGDNEGLRTPI